MKDMMDSKKLVIPAQAGIQASRNQFKTLDSRFHGTGMTKLDLPSLLQDHQIHHRRVIL